MNSKSKEKLNTSITCCGLGIIMLLVAAFCTDWRLGLLAVSLSMFALSYMGFQQTVNMAIEEKVQEGK